MIKVRQSVFETNSSSTHTITMCTEDQFTKWQKNEIFWDNDAEELIDETEMLESIANSCGQCSVDELLEAKEKSYQEYLKILAGYDYYTRSSFIELNTYEHFSKKYTSPSGDIVYAFGWYGSNY